MYDDEKHRKHMTEHHVDVSFTCFNAMGSGLFKCDLSLSNKEMMCFKVSKTPKSAVHAGTHVISHSPQILLCATAFKKMSSAREKVSNMTNGYQKLKSSVMWQAYRACWDGKIKPNFMFPFMLLCNKEIRPRRCQDGTRQIIHTGFSTCFLWASDLSQTWCWLRSHYGCYLRPIPQFSAGLAELTKWSSKYSFHPALAKSCKHNLDLICLNSVAQSFTAESYTW